MFSLCCVPVVIWQWYYKVISQQYNNLITAMWFSLSLQNCFNYWSTSSSQIIPSQCKTLNSTGKYKTYVCGWVKNSLIDFNNIQLKLTETDGVFTQCCIIRTERNVHKTLLTGTLEHIVSLIWCIQICLIFYSILKYLCWQKVSLWYL